MKIRFFTGLLFLFIALPGLADIPPGWDFTITSSSHLFSIGENAWPVINGVPIEPGDYIGVFYEDNGVQKCGGAVAWPAQGGTIVFAYGDDFITGDKDGFAYGETIQWKLYSFSMQTEVAATAILNPTYPTPGDVFIPEGLSGLFYLSSEGFFVYAWSEEDTLCQGYETQLHADPQGGSGSYSFEWVSDPEGFTSSEQNPWVQVNDTTTYTVTVYDGSNNCYDHTTIQTVPIPEINAGADDTLCQGETFTANAVTTYAETITWSTTGDGSFNFIHSPNAIYTPGQNDQENGMVMLLLTGEAQPPCDLTTTDTLILSILPPPSVFAGEDNSSCEKSIIPLQGEAENYQSLQWTTSGNGTFSDPNALNTDYYAEEVNEETVVTLTLQVEGNAPCDNAEDTLLLTLYPEPEGSAGSDEIICSSENYTTNGSAFNFSSATWSSSGDGLFENPNSLSTLYTPGAEDLNNGSVYLTLTIFPAAPCSQAIADSILLSFQPLPEVFAGYNQSVCELDTVSLSGYASHTESTLWSTSGDGTFTAPQALSTTYLPGPQDLQNEEVILTLTGNAIAPCASATDDQLTVTFIKSPIAHAGEDTAICSGTTHTTSGSVQYATGGSWSSNGSGEFADPTQLVTIYTPSQEDYTMGEVILTLTTSANSTCPATSDEMVLSFMQIPTVNAGEDQVIPFGTYTQLEGSVSGGSGDYFHSWEPSELIIGQHILTPTTTNLESSTLFTLFSTDNATGCSHQDQVTVYVTGGPLNSEVSATPDSVCPQEAVQLQCLPSGGSGDYSYTWSSNPPGFTSTLAAPLTYPEETTTYSATVSDGYNMVTNTVEVVVFALPTPDAGADQWIPHGTTTILEGSATGGSGNYNWLWSPGALLANPDQPQSATTQLYDETTFRLEVMDAETGCLSIDTTTVHLNTGALSSAPEASPQEACKGAEIQLFSHAQGGSEQYTFDWFSEPPGFYSNEENPTTIADESMRFWVEVHDGWNSVSNHTDLLVYPPNEIAIEALPNDTVCAYETLTLTAHSQLEASSWLWSPGGKTTPSITIDTTGLGVGAHTFSVQVTDEYNCLSSAEKRIFFDICQSTEERFEHRLTITPNPTKDFFRIQIPSAYLRGEMTILTIQGVPLLKKTITRDQIIIKDLKKAPGVYLVRIHAEGQKPLTEKLVYH
ncbi:MAG: hypothetical protein CSA95_06750 [Bacteroidetes bacterium]|nr:MAG: hypothetical protein CSA95_06750 [Bacteroidota bacterium]